jgi:uncharacterized protein YabE (DUF348 family)
MPGSFKHWSTVISRPVRRLAQAAIVTSLVGGALGISYYDKSVSLSIDGKTSSVHAFGTTVEDVLDKQGVTVGEHDVVAPALDSRVEDGQRIVVRYGRKLTVTLDGKTREYWTTATTVDRALAELGVRADAAKLSVSRSQTLGRAGLALTVTTPKPVSIAVDGKTLTDSSTALTVKDLLLENKVSFDRDDRINPAVTTPVTRGLKVTVQRVVASTVKSTESIPFPTVEKDDSSLFKGDTKVLTAGKEGAKVVTYRLVRVDGKLESKKAVSTSVTSQPVTKVVAVGTKSRPAAKTTSTVSGGNKPAADGLNWAALAECESGGNPSTNTGNGFYGMYQFDLQTWRSVGGSGYPHENSAGEQTYRAQILYSQRGDSPWPHCGSRLYS